jgi:hypothetical protein
MSSAAARAIMGSLTPRGDAPSNTPAQPEEDAQPGAAPAHGEADEREARDSRRHEIIFTVFMLALLVLITAAILMVLNNAMNTVPLLEEGAAP